MADVFKGITSIDQSSGKTAGLKHVTKEMKAKPASSVVSEAPKPAAAAAAAAAPAAKAAAAPAKPPVFQLDAMKWRVENQTGGVITLDADRVNPKQTVYIYGCKNTTIDIKGKVNSISVDGCTLSNVLAADVISGVELVNCKRMKVQANGIVPSVAIDKTDGCVLYLCEATKLVTIITASKSSEMNVSYPHDGRPDDAWHETPIPEQYKHRVQGMHVTAEVSDLYSH